MNKSEKGKIFIDGKYISMCTPMEVDYYTECIPKSLCAYAYNKILGKISKVKRVKDTLVMTVKITDKKLFKKLCKEYKDE